MHIPASLTDTIAKLKKPAVIAISGFGGAGKSTLAHALGEKLHAPVIGVDSFMKDRTVQDYSHWEIMDFERLTKEVIIPFLKGEHLIMYGHFDWSPNGIAETRTVQHHGLIIIEGVGLFRPELDQYFSYKIWVDCPIEEATQRGKKRDREVYGDPQDEYWDGVWQKNDAEYFVSCKPKESADRVFSN